VTVIHEALLTAVQGQPEPVVTAMLPLLPVDGTFTPIGETLYTQLEAA
jgi:hypothetical protein